jgi:hypothetical protein|tara:strand:+ start:724 stop:1191 length:468 start_codon:yes stop_codon:yes gene_type:complete
MTEETKQATPVVTNKFWIVKSGDTQVGTVQTVDEMDGGVVYVHGDVRERFPSIKYLTKAHNINFGKVVEKKNQDTYDVYGFPSAFKPHNTVFDVKRKLPLFTKNDKSKSFYCAGYYLIKFSGAWIPTNCPKSITLSRYEYLGPYSSESEAKAAAK